ncbi:MAG: hypothetical protein II802_03580 [Clostridia bacterium]|nr:hypothetical protein [Clostridia bacterium]
MIKREIKYFLGANSCTGFYSAFCESYDPYKGWKAYIIKGGPGTGKSSFMKRFADYAVQKGFDIILCPCSSDPDSLDGVIIPDKKAVILDGTAPHIVEPVYPGACEEILNFGRFWDSSEFSEKEDKIIEITLKNKMLHKTASSYLAACGQLIADNYKTASACTDFKKVETFSKGLCKKYIPQKGGTGKEWVRFISGITPKGIISYTDSITKSQNKIIVISDKYGSASSKIMENIRECSLAGGYEIITVKSAFLPELIIDHIIIPELSLAFVTENDYMTFSTSSRRIHARRFVNNSLLHNSKERLKFNNKVIDSVLLSACDTLKKAKSVHDDLEKNYINAMNFEALDDFFKEFSKKIFN